MRHGEWPRLVGAALVAGLLLSGCSHEPAPTPPPAPVAAVVHARFDPTLQPAAAVLALVPRDVATVTVTDYDQVRLDLGAPDVTDSSSPAQRARFWRRAAAERPLLTRGMLRADDARLLARYGFSSLDVAWEAHFLDASGADAGWVLAFRDGTDMSRVQQAVLDGAAPLASSDVDLADRLVSQGVTADPTQSWAGDADLAALAGSGTEPADSTYLTTQCSTQGSGQGTTTPGTQGADLDQLDGWSVQFQSTLVTAHLGADRLDLFDRLALDRADASFGSAFTGGAADPRTGRIGYVMTNPAAAAQLTLQRKLPFTDCS